MKPGNTVWEHLTITARDVVPLPVEAESWLDLAAYADIVFHIDASDDVAPSPARLRRRIEAPT